MNDVEAMALISKICSDFRGNLADHQAIQQALTTVRNKAFPVPTKEVSTIKPDFGDKKSEKKKK